MNLRQCATRIFVRSASSALLAFGVTALAAACGGKTVGDTGSGSSSSSSTSSSDGRTCINVEVTAADTACTVDSDCTQANTGQFCAGDCTCGDTPVNQAAFRSILTREQAVGTQDCSCGAPGNLSLVCASGQCQLVDAGTTFPFDGDQGDDGGQDFDGGQGDDAGIDDGGQGFDVSTPPPPFDGGQGADGGTCVLIEPGDFDDECTQASDCISIVAGEICNGDCDCGGSTISASEQSHYDQLIEGITFGECACPAFPPPSCVNGMCTVLAP